MLHLGMHVKAYINADGDVMEITISQADYIANIESIFVRDKQVAVKRQSCSAEMQRQFRALIGALIWCVTQSRPDVAFNVSVISTRIQAPTVPDVLEENKVLAQIERKVVKL